MKYCEYCGRQLQEGTDVCPGCGSTVSFFEKSEKNMTATSSVKYCAYCGNQLLKEAVMCPKCGKAVDDKKVAVANAEKSRILKLVVKILMLVAIGSCVVNLLETMFATPTWFVINIGQFEISYKIFVHSIPLFWIIPMTVHYFKATKQNQPIKIGFKVCTLIFVNFVAGILMLCDTDSQTTVQKNNETR